MAYQIILQPDKTFAIWSTIVDAFVMTGGSREEILEFFHEEQLEMVDKRIGDIIDQLEQGKKPYYQFTMDWDHALDVYREVHGEDWKEGEDG